MSTRGGYRQKMNAKQQQSRRVSVSPTVPLAPAPRASVGTKTPTTRAVATTAAVSTIKKGNRGGNKRKGTNTVSATTQNKKRVPASGKLNHCGTTRTTTASASVNRRKRTATTTQRGTTKAASRTASGFALGFAPATAPASETVPTNRA